MRGQFETYFLCVAKAKANNICSKCKHKVICWAQYICVSLAGSKCVHIYVVHANKYISIGNFANGGTLRIKLAYAEVVLHMNIYVRNK